MNKDFGVIFDMDGVIVNSNPAHKESLKLFLDKYGKEMSESYLVNEVFGRTNAEWIPALFGDLSNEEVKKLADEKEKIFRNIFDPRKEMVSGLKVLLDMLNDQGVKTAVATSAPVENADFILSKLSIQEKFDIVLDSSHVNSGKPDPEIYLKASEALGYSADQCIIFEDSLSGIEAARRAGAKVIGLTTTHTPEELTDCDKVIENFKNLDHDDLSILFNGSH